MLFINRTDNCCPIFQIKTKGGCLGMTAQDVHCCSENTDEDLCVNDSNDSSNSSEMHICGKFQTLTHLCD